MKADKLQTFERDYKRISPTVRKKLDKQLHLLLADLRHPSLGVRKMINQRDIYEARVDIHNRMTFEMRGDTIILRRVGTHEIYRKP